MRNKIIFILSIILVISGVFHSCDKIAEDDYLTPLPDIDWQGQRVLIEDFTGMRCSNCPEAAGVAEGLQDLYPERVIVISNHVNLSNASSLGSPDTLTSNIGNDYFTQFYTIKPVTLPMGMINRINLSSGRLFQHSQWNGLVTSQLRNLPDFDLEIKNSFSNPDSVLTVKVTATPRKNIEGQYKLTVLITESGIIGLQKDANTEGGIIRDYNHKHVLRTAITSSSEMINGLASKGVAIEKTYQKKIPFRWEKGGYANINNCHVVAFISDTSETIKQVVEAGLK